MPKRHSLSLRSFYFTGVLLAIHRTDGLSGEWRLGPLLCWLRPRVCHLRFLCPRYRSLYLTSTLSFLSLCDLLFLLKGKYLPYCVGLEVSYLLQSYLAHRYQNPYIFSSKFQEGVGEGLNLTHLIDLVCRKMRLLLISMAYEDAPNAVALILGGRIKGDIRNRYVREIIALCVTSLSYRILDIGYKTSHSSLGLLGLKVASII